MPARPFVVRPWARTDREGVVALISGIQRGEFGLSITPQDQPDLMDIDGFYRWQGRPGAGEFRVAEAAETAPVNKIHSFRKQPQAAQRSCPPSLSRSARA